MSDDPKNLQLPDPAEQPEEPQGYSLELPQGDSAVPELGEMQQPVPETPPADEDAISEMRQSLAREEAEQPRKPRSTGGLIQRITGALRRVTGPLSRSQPSEEASSLPHDTPPSTEPQEMPEDLISGRLEGIMPGEIPYQAEIEEPKFFEGAYAEDDAALPEEEVPPAEENLLEEPLLTGDEPISLLDSGAVAALGKAEEEARAVENVPDWMAEIRKSDVGPETRPGERAEQPGPEAVPPHAQEKPHGFTAPLRSFLTGVLGRQKPPEEEMPDDLLAGRLDRSLTAGPAGKRKPAGKSKSGNAPSEEEKSGTGALRAILGELLQRPSGESAAPAAPEEIPQPSPAESAPQAAPDALPQAPTGESIFEVTPVEDQEHPPSESTFQAAPDETPEPLPDESIPSSAAVEPSQPLPGEINPPPASEEGKPPARRVVTSSLRKAFYADLAEIRDERAGAEAQPGERSKTSGPAETPSQQTEKPRGLTAPLRSFITGVLGHEASRKQEDEMPDDLLAGRLDRSLASGPGADEHKPSATPKPGAAPAEEEGKKKSSTAALRAILAETLRRKPGGSTPPVAPGETPQPPTSEDIPPVARVETPEGTPGETKPPAEDQRVVKRVSTSSLRKSFFADLDEMELETGQLNPDKQVQAPPPSGTTSELPEDRLNMFDQQPGTPPSRKKPTGGLILDEPMDLSPEEEELLWGKGESAEPAAEVEESHPAPAPEPPMFTEEEIWGQPGAEEQPPAPARAPVEPAWSEPIEPVHQTTGSLFEPLSDADYAQSFLTGSLAERQEEKPPVNLMQQALGRSTPDEYSPQNLRAIALEGVVDEGPAGGAYPSLLDEEDWEEGISTGPFSLKTWLNKRSAIEKFLLVEGIVVLLAMVIAIPFFTFIIAGGKVPSASTVQQRWASPRPLPADLPYPVGLTLPGGWSFPLQKSTFIKGEWKPASPEWLEGTELRRVVALPWNRQTEAVVQTFKSGDNIQVNLSNQATMAFTVESIDRVPTKDTSIFSDLTPSLVIVLYKENSAERWVVECLPAR